MAAAPISYGNDYAADQASIDRARKYADLMQQQSMQTDQQITAGGWVVPTPKMAGVAKALQGISAGLGNYMADKKQRDLATKEKTDLTNTLTDAQKAYMGTPAVNTTPATPNDDNGNPMPAPQTPAVAGDPMKYAQILMQNPQTMQMGMQASQQAMQQQKWAQLLGGDQSAASAPQGAPGGGMPGAPAGGSPDASGMSPQVAQQGQQVAGVLQASGITRQEAQASLLADPSGKQLSEKVLAARAEAQKPVVNRGYGIGTMQNGRYVPDPASTGQALGMESGKADIAAGHKVVAVPQADGTTRYMTESQQIQQTGAAPPAAVPQGGIPGYMGQQPNGRFQGDPQAIMQQIQAIPNPNERAAAMQAFQNQAANKNPQAGAPYLNNPAINPQGAQPSAAPAAPVSGAQPQTTMPTPAPQSGLPGFSAGQSTLDKSMMEKQGDTAGTVEAQINHDGDSAMQKIAQNNKMVDLIPQVTTGPMAKQITNFKMLGKQLGIDLGDPSSNQEFEKYAIKGALEGAKQIYGARLTNQDVMSQIASNPGTSMTEKALYQLIKYDNVQQQRLIDKQAAYFQEFPKTGLPKNQFGMWFNQTHPFMGLSAPQAGQTAQQTAPAQSAPASVPASAAVKRYNPVTGKIE